MSSRKFRVAVLVSNSWCRDTTLPNHPELPSITFHSLAPGSLGIAHSGEPRRRRLLGCGERTKRHITYLQLCILLPCSARRMERRVPNGGLPCAGRRCSHRVSRRGGLPPAPPLSPSPRSNGWQMALSQVLVLKRAFPSRSLSLPSTVSCCLPHCPS